MAPPSLSAAARQLLLPRTRRGLVQLRCMNTTPTASAPPSEASHAPAPRPSTTTTTTASAPLPYRIGRSAALNLPVYHRIKSGGTNRTTEVKKVEGDARELSRHLREELSLETKINSRTNHVIIKGFHKDKVVSWLAERGF